MQTFFKLWQHRLKKYSHLVKVYAQFLKIYIKIIFIKLSSKKEVVTIILTQQLGDIVAVEPLLEQIRTKHNQSIIIWIVKPIFRELLINNPNIDYILNDFCANQRHLLIKSGILGKVYNLQFKNNSYCEVCNTYVENPVADLKDITIHNYYFQGNLLTIQQKIAGFEVIDQTPKLYLNSKEILKIDSLNLPENFMVIHCQSAQNSRNWNKSQWAIFVEYFLKSSKISIIEIGLSSELEINAEKYINLCGKLSILETAEVIKRAKLFVGIDSGPAHLANAVDTFGVILIGKLADFINHIPYSGAYKSGEKAIIIRNTSGPSSEIEVMTVINTIVDKKLI